jgi:hypothetical protein
MRLGLPLRRTLRPGTRVKSPPVGARRSGALVAGAALALTLTLGAGAGSPMAGDAAALTAWPVFQFDSARSGVNSAEQSIGTSNLNQLVLHWSATLPAIADSSPVEQNGVVYLTTKQGEAIALDELSGSELWSATTSGASPFMTATPALDPSGEWLYSYGLDGMVHKYATSTGAEALGGGWPARITNQPDVEKGSAALNVANGYLYVTTSGYPGDYGHYVGHLVAIDLATGQANVFNTLCSNLTTLLTDQAGASNYCPDRQSGVWGRGGAVVDPTNGHVYLATGNGPWNGTTDWGDSVLELDASGTALLDSYTPTNWQSLDNNDTDLGSIAPVLLPSQPTSSTPCCRCRSARMAWCGS